MNKLGSNTQTLASAEEKYTRLQSNERLNGSNLSVQGGIDHPKTGQKAHIDLAAG